MELNGIFPPSCCILAAMIEVKNQLKTVLIADLYDTTKVTDMKQIQFASHKEDAAVDINTEHRVEKIALWSAPYRGKVSKPCKYFRNQR